MRPFVISTAVIVLAGCATEAPVITASTAPVIVMGENETLTPQTKLTCHREAQAGTVIIRMVCETEQSIADRVAMQERLRNMARPSSNPHPGM